MIAGLFGAHRDTHDFEAVGEGREHRLQSLDDHFVVIDDNPHRSMRSRWGITGRLPKRGYGRLSPPHTHWHDLLVGPRPVRTR